jgi:D-amino peptidase
MVMKLYISADLEGVCGVTSKAQCYPHPQTVSAYHHAVEALGREIQAILRGLATSAHHCPCPDPLTVVVNDAHGPMSNLTLAHLRPPPSSPDEGAQALQQHWPAVHLLGGKPKLSAMMAGLNDSFNAVMLVGYHAKAQTQHGVLAHSFHDLIADISLNGQSVGETWLNVLYAHEHGVPVMLGSGDAAFCDELQALAPKTWTISTKTGLGWAAACHEPEAYVLQELTAQAANVLDALKAKVSRAPLSWLPEPPMTLRLALTHPVAADLVAQQPHWQRLDGVTLQTTQGTFLSAYQALQGAYAVLSLAPQYLML